MSRAIEYIIRHSVLNWVAVGFCFSQALHEPTAGVAVLDLAIGSICFLCAVHGK